MEGTGAFGGGINSEFLRSGRWFAAGFLLRYVPDGHLATGSVADGLQMIVATVILSVDKIFCHTHHSRIMQ